MLVGVTDLRAPDALVEAPAEAPSDPESSALETKGERTRRRLLELAIDRFGTQGYRATSVSEIARAAGLTQAAVYAYFDNKEALFVSAVDADAASAITSVLARVETVPATQLVPFTLALLIGELELHPLAKRVLSGKEPEALVRLVNLPALAEFTEFVRARIDEARAAGDVRADVDPEVFANGAETLILCLLLAISQVGQTTEARRQLGVVNLFELALRPPGADE